MKQDELKQTAARAAIAYVTDGIIGVGTGTTVNFFIDVLADARHNLEGAVASSEATTRRLKHLGIPILDINTVEALHVYVDSADEITEQMCMVKGGGGALTCEKIIAAISKQFICIADSTKFVPILGMFPLPVEVIPMARSHVVREMAKLGGRAIPREDFVTDNGNIILDVHGLTIPNPVQLEGRINQITGVVTNGLFAMRPADLLLLGTQEGVKVIANKHRS